MILDKIIRLTETSTDTPSGDEFHIPTEGEVVTFFEELWINIVEWAKTTGLKLVIGVIVLFLLFKLINFVCSRIKKTLHKHHVDKTIEVVVLNLIRKGLKIVLFIMFIGFIGIETTSIAALITSAGVGIGLALQGSLSNLAGGLILLLMRPFKVGDYVESNGQGGTVEDIKLFYTYLITPDNKVVMIPNGNVANGTIINYSQKDTRRVDLTFSIAYEDDFEKAKALILECVKKVGLQLENPAPFINISNHGASSIDIVTRVWCKSDDYWTIYFKMLEEVKVAFDKNGITIPYQQLDVNIKK